MYLTDNPKIKEALIARWKSLDIYHETGSGRLSFKEVVRDAMERAPELRITSDRLSKYISGYENKGKKYGLSEEQITWLLYRYMIPFRLTIGQPEVRDGKIEYVIPEYSEYNALRLLKIYEERNGKI